MLLRRVAAVAVLVAVRGAVAVPGAAAQCSGREDDCALPLDLPFWMAGFIAVVWLAGVWLLVAMARWWFRARAERRRARRDRSRPGTAIRLE